MAEPSREPEEEPPLPRTIEETLAGLPASVGQDLRHLLEQAPPGAGRVIQAVLQYHSGPLPPPEALAGYDAVEPGAAGRIISMAERQQTHAHRMATSTLRSESVYRLCGILAAVLITGGAIVGAVICALFNHEKAAIALGAAAGVSTLAGVFIRGRDMTRVQDAPTPPARSDNG